MSDHIDELIKEFAISSDELLKECDIQSNQYSHPYIDRSKMIFDLENTNINQLNTYNAIRMLYRNLYDLRSKGVIQSDGTIVGREIHPISNYTMSVNYINDFSISPCFTTEDNDFIESICKIYPNAYYAFMDKGPYSDYYQKRLKTFVQIESTNKSSRINIGTSDFFSSNIQINPLLYTFSYIDSDKKIHYMDADYFLENNLYNMLFTKESFILKGNQLSIPLWLLITNLDSTQRNLYDDDGEFIGTEDVYKNQQMLMKDNYTTELMLILQQPSRFYNFNKQNDFEVEDETLKVIEQETRGHLFFDSLTELLFRKIKDFIELNDTENKEKHLRKAEYLRQIVFEPIIRNSMECGDTGGIPIDQYCSLNTYKQFNESVQKDMGELVKNDRIDEYLFNVYRHQYEIVFKDFFKYLPYILSPAYMYDIQSPSMNIFYTALTIMVIKEMYYNSDHTDYDKVMDILFNILNHVDNLEIKQDMFDKVFTNKILSKYIMPHLKLILKVLISSKSAINYDESKVNDIDTYFNDNKFYSYIENEVDDSITINKALILLTEFFHKTESLRYFDASTFSIDYSLLELKENRKTLKLFADSLMEACYIHMNILGHEYSDRRELIGLDTTRVAKQNIDLIKQWVVDNKQYYVNSYHSYLSVINLYTSLVYCIQISIDNLSVNSINIGPYNSSNIRRSQSLWTILKRYAIHMTYMNNNSYGIYNDVKISNNDKISIQNYMVSQRIKWLTYGLHLRVWFNDGYFFYTNYKKLVLNNIKEIINTNTSLYNTYGNLEELPLFREYTKNQFVLPLPNIGLSLYPMAGSYSILANANCIKFYLDNSNSTIVNLIHYGLKDIAVGDSLSSILGKRLDCVREIINNKKLSFNNLRRFQKLYEHLGKSKYFEIALSSNLDYIYKNIIRSYFINNKNECINLNNSTYDISFFEKTNDSCSYPLAYNNSWASRLISKILNFTNNKEYMSLISRLITLYRINVANFKTWHIRNESDSIPNMYYKKFYGYNTMFSLFINSYNDSYDKIYKSDNEKNGLFNKILKIIYTGNHYNNPYTLSNIFSITDAKFSFEENIVNNTAGGTIYALYESPLALMIYNNMNFNSGLIEPSIEQLFMLGLDLYARIYLTMKKLLIDLCKNGKPLEKIIQENNCSLEQAKDIFINECITLFYIILDNDKYRENINKIFSNIKDKNNIYSFICIFGQFIDYDYISNQIVHCLDNQYKCNDSDVIRFMNDILSNKKESIQKFNYYCSCIEKIDNQLNYIIKLLEQSKNGTLLDSVSIEGLLNNEDSNTFNEFKEEYLSTLEDKKRQSMTNYPLSINDSTGIVETNYINRSSLLSEYISYHIIGMSEEEYKNLSDSAKKEYDESIQRIQSSIDQVEIDYNSEISRLESELAQLRRAKDIADGKRVFDVKEGSTLNPSDLEMYTLINEKRDINLVLFDKMNQLEVEIRSMKEILLDTRHMIQLLLDGKNMNNIQEIVQQQEEKSEDNEEESDQENINIVQDNNQSLDIDTLNNFAIKVNQNNINRIIIQDDHQYRLPIQPECLEDRVIFRSNTGYEYIILKDYNVDYNLDTILNLIQNRNITYGLGFIRSTYKNIKDISEDILNNSYSVIDKGKASYNDYVYIPKYFLIKYLPSVGKPLGINEKNDRKRVDKAKLILQNVPIYSCDDYNLICPIDNIPISFNQKKEFIISDINDRVAIYNKKKTDKIIEYLMTSNVMNNWDNDNMTLYARCIFMRSVFRLNVNINTQFI